MHDASRLLGDGLVHAFERQHGIDIIIHDEVLRDNASARWVPMCEPRLRHTALPGAICPLPDVTCVRCVAELMR